MTDAPCLLLPTNFVQKLSTVPKLVTNIDESPLALLSARALDEAPEAGSMEYWQT